MGWLYATAINFAASVGIFTVAGYLLDRWLNTAPWILISGLVFGLVGGTIKFVVDGRRAINQGVAEIAGKHNWRPVEEPEPSDSNPDESAPSKDSPHARL